MHIDMDTHYTPFDALRRLDGNSARRTAVRAGSSAGDEVIYYHNTPTARIPLFRSQNGWRTWIRMASSKQC